MNSAEYFFFKWLIIDKQITQEQFEKLTAEEYFKLQLDYMEYRKQKGL